MRQAFAFDHRTDIVEHHRLQHRRPHRRQNVDDQAAARGADKGPVLDAERGEAGDDVACFDDHVIVFPVGIVGRAAAPAVVEGDDLARLLGVTRQEQGEIVEIAGVARQAGEADDRQSGAAIVPIDSGMQLQPVLRGIEEV